MINVVSLKCEFKGCMIIPNFGLPNESPKFCYTHKTIEMINLRKVICKFEGCNLIPLFGYPDGKREYCVKHKLNDMIDVCSKKCEYEGCLKQPAFGYPGQKRQFCGDHKLSDMIDVISKRCQYEDCSLRPNFGYYGESAIYCSIHKLDNMIDLKHKKCEFTGCTIQATHGYENEKARFCAHHKLPNMIIVRAKYCKLCPTLLSNPLYGDYCFRCFVNMNPNNIIVRNHKTKERYVADFIKDKFPNLTINLDKIIEGGCSRRRPDIYIDLGISTIIIEIDEDQHSSYDDECENKRIMEIFQDAGNRPMHFIRFNPDKYVNYENKIIQSCWNTSKTGLYCIDKNMKSEWHKRMNILSNTLYTVINEPPEKELNIIYLFYDGFL